MQIHSSSVISVLPPRPPVFARRSVISVLPPRPPVFARRQNHVYNPLHMISPNRSQPFRRSFSPGLSSQRGIIRCFHPSSPGGDVPENKQGLGLNLLVETAKFIWDSVDYPFISLFVLLAFLKCGNSISPTVVTEKYFESTLKGSVIIVGAWALCRFKGKLCMTFLPGQRRWAGYFVATERLSSIGIILLTILLLVIHCQVGWKLVASVGGMGALGAFDKVGKLFKIIAFQFCRPFSIGDWIKIGKFEGQVKEIGLTTTTLMSPQQIPLKVPNSCFGDKTLLNFYDVDYHEVVQKIPIKINNFSRIEDLIANISPEVVEMICSHDEVMVNKGLPWCCLSNVFTTHLELAIGYKTIMMERDGLHKTNGKILLKLIEIFKKSNIDIA